MTKYNDQMKRLGFNQGGYVIQKGDTLSELALRFNTTVSELLKANKKIKNADLIFAGSTLNLPAQKQKIDIKAGEIPEEDMKKLTELKLNHRRKGQEPANTTDADEIKTTVISRKLGGVNATNKDKIRKDKIIPLNIRQFVYDLFGGSDDLTENDLDTEELESLKKLITPEVLKKQRLEYKDYKTTAKPELVYADVGGAGGIDNPISKSFKNPAYSLKTTLGQASVYKDNNNNIIVEDAYDFNDAEGRITLGSFINDLKAIKSNPLYFLPRKTAKYFGSKPGEGSKIKINLGKIL